MAVGDIVALSHFLASPGLWAPELHGRVNAVVGADSTVLWQNGVLSTVPTARLREVGPTSQTLDYLGKYVQVIGFPTFTAPDFGGQPKSPAASGIVLDVFDAAGQGESPAQPRALVATEDGEGLLLIDFALDGFVFNPGRNAFEVDGGRRNV